MNGVCGSFSIFSSARYLITNDIDYLYAALAYPLAGLLFDFFDGKVARWRKESSMIGQELDSLADLVRLTSTELMFVYSYSVLDLIRRSTCFTGLRCGSQDLPRHSRTHRIHLLWACAFSSVQCYGCICAQGFERKGQILRRLADPILPRTCCSAELLDVKRLDRGKGRYPWWYHPFVGHRRWQRGNSHGFICVWNMGGCDGQ